MRKRRISEVVAFSKSIIRWFKIGDRIIYLEYGLLALLVLLPLLKPGYIFALDMVFTPKIRFPQEISPVPLALYLLNYVIPSQVIEKILLFLVLFLSGIGMHRLIPAKKEWPKYFAAILYIFNPFVFQRLTAGQLGIVEAYALTPFLVKTILDFLDEMNLRRALGIAVLTSVIFAFSLHNGVFAVLFGTVAVFVFLIRNLREPAKIFPILKYGSILILALLLLNVFWLIPFFKGSVLGAQTMSRFSEKDIIGFQSVADPTFGVLFNVAAMYGFWGERSERFISPKDLLPGWHIIFLLIFVVVVWGLVAGLRNRESRFRAITFGTVGVISFILAVGVAHPIFAPIFWFLVRKIPFFVGFRESQKFVALLILSYSFLGGLGLDDILRRFEGLRRIPKKLFLVIPALFLILPVIYTYPMLWGFGGYLRVTPDYPKDWYEVNEFLNADKADFKVLFLPWHQYMHFSFVGKVIANPAKDFFDKPVIQGDNIEFGPIYTQVRKPSSIYIEKNFVKAAPNVTDMGKKLIPLKVKYVILAKEVDFQKYSYLDSQKDLKLVMDTETLSVYLNEEFK